MVAGDDLRLRCPAFDGRTSRHSVYYFSFRPHGRMGVAPKRIITAHSPSSQRPAPNFQTPGVLAIHFALGHRACEGLFADLMPPITRVSRPGYGLASYDSVNVSLLSDAVKR